MKNPPVLDERHKCQGTASVEPKSRSNDLFLTPPAVVQRQRSDKTKPLAGQRRAVIIDAGLSLVAYRIQTNSGNDMESFRVYVSVDIAPRTEV